MTNSVYRDRAHLVALLAAQLPSHIGLTDPDEPDWHVIVIDSPQGQMSWHVAAEDMDLFRHVRRTEPGDAPWDGHSTEEKYERIRRLVGSLLTVTPTGEGSDA
jgi:hypothetical protein